MFGCAKLLQGEMEGQKHGNLFLSESLSAVLSEMVVVEGKGTRMREPLTIPLEDKSGGSQFIKP